MDCRDCQTSWDVPVPYLRNTIPESLCTPTLKERDTHTNGKGKKVSSIPCHIGRSYQYNHIDIVRTQFKSCFTACATSSPCPHEYSWKDPTPCLVNKGEYDSQSHVTRNISNVAPTSEEIGNIKCLVATHKDIKMDVRLSKSGHVRVLNHGKVEGEY